MDAAVEPDVMRPGAGSGQGIDCHMNVDRRLGGAASGVFMAFWITNDA